MKKHVTTKNINIQPDHDKSIDTAPDYERRVHRADSKILNHLTKIIEI
jgi:hypothetical protein